MEGGDRGIAEATAPATSSFSRPAFGCLACQPVDITAAGFMLQSGPERKRREGVADWARMGKSSWRRDVEGSGVLGAGGGEGRGMGLVFGVDGLSRKTEQRQLCTVPP